MRRASPGGRRLLKLGVCFIQHLTGFFCHNNCDMNVTVQPGEHTLGSIKFDLNVPAAADLRVQTFTAPTRKGEK